MVFPGATSWITFSTGVWTCVKISGDLLLVYWSTHSCLSVQIQLLDLTTASCSILQIRQRTVSVSVLLFQDEMRGEDICSRAL